MNLQENTLQQALAQAEQLLNLGKHAQAETLYRQLLQQNPDCHQAINGLAIIAYKHSQLELAEQYQQQAIKLSPETCVYYRNLCEILRANGKIAEAISAGEYAIQQAPEDIHALYNLCLAYTDAGNVHQAIQRYRKLTALNPKHYLGYNNLGACLEKQGDYAGAMAAYEQATAIKPDHAEAQNNLGAIYSREGKLKQAIDCFNKAIAAQPLFVDPHFNLASLKSYTPDDPQLKQLKNLQLNQDKLSVNARIRLNFALGKALEDCHEYDSAFFAYEAGNLLKEDLTPDLSQQQKKIQEKILQTDFSIKKKPAKTRSTEPTPLFIIGMPRSGSSLIEQILASHPEIHGAGELPLLDQVITGFQPEIFYTAWINTISDDELTSLGQQYLEKLKQVAGTDKPFICDKMPGNFFYAGLIKRMLPQAKIIHSLRHPMDSCFSSYARLFNDTMEFTYSLNRLADYYNRYESIMHHWHSQLPENSIIDVHYEHLIEDIEKETRRILSHLELDWDTQCLQFHKNLRSVKTASIAQVRQPLYTSSVARWERFSTQLEPLRQKLQSRYYDINKDR